MKNIHLPTDRPSPWKKSCWKWTEETD